MSDQISTKQKVIDQYKNGTKISDISKNLGISTSYIYKIRRQEDIPKRQKISKTSKSVAVKDVSDTDTDSDCSTVIEHVKDNSGPKIQIDTVTKNDNDDDSEEFVIETKTKSHHGDNDQLDDFDEFLKRSEIELQDNMKEREVKATIEDDENVFDLNDGVVSKPEEIIDQSEPLDFEGCEQNEEQEPKEPKEKKNESNKYRDAMLTKEEKERISTVPLKGTDLINLGVIDDFTQQKRKELILVIKSYIHEFNDQLREQMFGNNKAEVKKYLTRLNGLSLERLQDCLDEIRLTCNGKNQVKIMKHVLLTSTNVIENVTTRYGFDLQGWTRFLEQQEELDNIIKTLRAENAVYFDQFYKPEYRLCMLLGQSALQVNSYNRLKKMMQQKEEQSTKEPEGVLKKSSSKKLTLDEIKEKINNL